MSLSPDFSKKLLDLQESASVSIQISINTYFDVIKTLVDDFSTKKGTNIFYISATIPSRNIYSVLEMYGTNTANLYFVDCISHIMMSTTEYSDKILYVESPTMLETIMIKIDFLHRKFKDRPSLVIIDSVNSLAIHNDLKILSEFLHIFVTNLRAKSSYLFILSMKEQSNAEINNTLNLVSDEIINSE
ncbi:MAG: hypothetical protein QW258_01350 [Thermoplasmata archaeon]